ncbi:MAG: flagellin, partial [Armatimonadota bacterium]
MGLRINLNVAAMSASRYLEGTETRLQKSMERLSSGYTINSAADDPAGLVISEKLRAQTGGLATAIKNAGDGVNMVRTTEAALQEVSTLLRAMRDLAVHASNTGPNDAASIAADQAQVNSTIQALNKISDETMFMSRKLL